jgi:hypothetical protein
VYVALLAGALRFLHFALFDDTFFSLSSAEQNRTAFVHLGVDFALLAVAAALGWRITRAGQMTTQYRWLYQKTSPLTWRARPAARGE